MNPNTLDQQAFNLAKSIRRAETGTSTDPYNAKGASGEYGAYQYMPDTWKGWAGEILGNPNAPMTVENQNKVAYTRIKKWKDEGYNPAQIASLWNSGREDGYKVGGVGTNKQGVDYNVPEYVKKVSAYYNETKMGSGQPAMGGVPQGIGPVNIPPPPPVQPPAPVTPPAETVEPQKESLARRIANFTGMGKTADTLGNMIARSRLGAELTGGDYETNMQYVEKPTGSEKAGALLNIGALGLGAASAGVAGTKLAGGKLLGALSTGIKGGAISGGAAGLASGLENNDDIQTTALKTAGGTLLGGGLGFVTPAAGALTRTAKPVARATINMAKNVAEGADEMVATQVRVAKMPKVEQAVVRAGLPEQVIADVKNTTPQTQKTFSQMLDMHKRSLMDKNYAKSNMVKQVPAQTMLKYVDGIKANSDVAAKNLTRIADTNPAERVDFSRAFQTYIDTLAKKGVRVDPMTGKFMSDGRIPKSEMKYYDDIYNEIQAVVKDDPNLTRKQAHVLRQRLYATLDSATRQGGKPGQRPFSSDVDNDVNVFRKELASLLGPEYQKAAADYAQNEKVLSEVAKLAGTTIDKISAKDRKLGEVLMRSLGNASDRPQTLIEDVMAAAQRNGIKTDVDINAQIEFADLLEKLYGSTQSRTLAAQVREGVGRANEDAAGAVPDVISGNITSAILNKARDLSGKSSDDQIKAFEDFIREINKDKGLFN